MLGNRTIFFPFSRIVEMVGHRQKFLKGFLKTWLYEYRHPRMNSTITQLVLCIFFYFAGFGSPAFRKSGRCARCARDSLPGESRGSFSPLMHKIAKGGGESTPQDIRKCHPSFISNLSIFPKRENGNGTQKVPGEATVRNIFEIAPKLYC